MDLRCAHPPRKRLSLAAALVACNTASPPTPAPRARPELLVTPPAPTRCDLGGVAGTTMWMDIPPSASACDVQRLALNNFLYLARPDAGGHPRMMSYAPWYEAIPQDGSPPRWVDGHKPLRTRALRKTALEGQPGDSFDLVDVHRHKIGYDVRVNRTFVEYLVSSGSYQQAVLAQLAASYAADPATGGVWLPSGSATTEGAISLKLSWRRFGEEAKCPADRMHCERDTLGIWWGLLGVHMVQKTPTMGEMTWASFEHVANAPDCSPGGTRPISEAPADPAAPGKTFNINARLGLKTGWSLFDAAGYQAKGGDGTRCPVPDGAYQYTVAADGTTLQNQGCAAPTVPALCNTDPRHPFFYEPAVEGANRVNVCRVTAQPACVGDGSPADVVACLNESYLREFPAGLDNKWRYYFLVGTEYTDAHGAAVGCFRFDDGPVVATTPPRTRYPSNCGGSQTAPKVTRVGNTDLANTTMETWMQAGACLESAPGATPILGRDCFGCHNPGTNKPSFPFGMGDFSFVFDRIPLATPPANPAG
jgi:hypothetical protein